MSHRFSQCYSVRSPGAGSVNTWELDRKASSRPPSRLLIWNQTAEPRSSPGDSYTRPSLRTGDYPCTSSWTSVRPYTVFAKADLDHWAHPRLHIWFIGAVGPGGGVQRSTQFQCAARLRISGVWQMGLPCFPHTATFSASRWALYLECVSVPLAYCLDYPF